MKKISRFVTCLMVLIVFITTPKVSFAYEAETEAEVIQEATETEAEVIRKAVETDAEVIQETAETDAEVIQETVETEAEIIQEDTETELVQRAEEEEELIEIDHEGFCDKYYIHYNIIKTKEENYFKIKYFGEIEIFDGEDLMKIFAEQRQQQEYIKSYVESKGGSYNFNVSPPRGTGAILYDMEEFETRNDAIKFASNKFDFSVFEDNGKFLVTFLRQECLKFSIKINGSGSSYENIDIGNFINTAGEQSGKKFDAFKPPITNEDVLKEEQPIEKIDAFEPPIINEDVLKEEQPIEKIDVFEPPIINEDVLKEEQPIEKIDAFESLIANEDVLKEEQTIEAPKTGENNLLLFWSMIECFFISLLVIFLSYFKKVSNK